MEAFEVFVVTTKHGHFIFFAKTAAYRRFNAEQKKGEEPTLDRCLVSSVEKEK